MRGLDNLRGDMLGIPAKSARMSVQMLQGNAIRGNRIAQNNARASSGKHGKHYPNAFEVEALAPLTWVYGPNAGRPQGNMSFEYGSRNQPPHLDLNRSADVIGPSLEKDARKMLGRLFW
jgi:hypothetical protein